MRVTMFLATRGAPLAVSIPSWSVSQSQGSPLPGHLTFTWNRAFLSLCKTQIGRKPSPEGEGPELAAGLSVL